MMTTKLRFCLITAIVAVTALTMRAVDPTLTKYTAAECQGSAMPYPAVDVAWAAVPDSLEPLMVNHVGRHGSRFMASNRQLRLLTDALAQAQASSTLTPAGKQLVALCRRIDAATDGRWGALDSLGMAEERAIATRFAATFPDLLKGGRVSALSSYSPRCIMSMYEFCHQLSRLDNNISVNTNSGRQWSWMLRPFDDDIDYAEYRESKAWQQPVDELTARTLPLTPLKRVLGDAYPLGDTSDPATVALALAHYSVIASCGSLGIGCKVADWFKPEEYNALWAIGNLRRNLQYSASTLSLAPADMAARLLLELIDTTEQIINGENSHRIILRFGHAETLMPLLALMHLPGCYYMTNYFDTVASHWRDWELAPMAANLRLVLLRGPGSKLYLRVDLNEKPVPLIPGRPDIYTPWEQARTYLERCLPLILQP